MGGNTFKMMSRYRYPILFSVGLCYSISVLSYILNDCNRQNINNIHKMYNEKIKALEDRILNNKKEKNIE